MSVHVESCPFCGSWEAEPKTTSISRDGRWTNWVAMHCPGCRAQGPACREVGEARLQWNDQLPKMRQQSLLK